MKHMKNTPAAKQEQVSVQEGEPVSCSCRKTTCALKMTLLLGSIWGSAMLISGAILVSNPKLPPFQKQLPQKTAGVSDTAIQKYIESNPKVILDAVNKYLADQQKAEAAAQQAEPQVAPQEIIDEIVADKSNYSLGNPNGKFVIIEFFDHRCGWCKRTNAALREALAKGDAKNIRWIPIDTPIFGEDSERIARYVLAAGKQGKYAEMHEAVASATKTDKDSLLEIAKKLGLDTNKLATDAESDEIKAKMEANQKYARALNISGVPMLIVNGKINPGALLGERLDAAIKESQNVK